MAEPMSLQGPVFKVNGQLMLLIPLDAGGIEAAHSVSEALACPIKWQCEGDERHVGCSLRAQQQTIRR